MGAPNPYGPPGGMMPNPYGQMQMGQRGPIGKCRSPGMVILLSIVTLGIYQIIWRYSMFEELYQYRRTGWSGGLALVFTFVPILNMVGLAIFWLLPGYIGDLYQEDGRQKPITGLHGFWIFLPIAGIFIWIAGIQSRMNEFWMSKGAPPP
jgi:hypothetical protein